MLSLMMDLCKECAQATSQKKKLLIREKIGVFWSRLMDHAIQEYQAEINLGADFESASDNYFGTKDLLAECEMSCSECKNRKEAKLYLIISDYYSLPNEDGAKSTAEKKAPTPKTFDENNKGAKKTPTSLVEYRLEKQKKDK